MLGISVGELTVQAAWVAMLAILALTLAGWRKPARAAPLSPRGTTDSESDPNEDADPNSDGEPVAVVITAVPLERPTTFAQRLLAAAATAGLSVLTGIMLAIAISFAAVVAVVWATNLLGR
jgi:hypothetical protein